MRDIKFRVWEPLNKRMYLMNFALYVEVNGYKHFALPIKWQSLNNSYTSMNLDALEIMQYTGLNDKNGVEVYEGDILKCVSEKVKLIDNKPTGEIVTKIKTIEWQEDWTRFQLKKLDGEFELLPCTKQEWITKFYEVIGNVYANPELLEQR